MMTTGLYILDENGKPVQASDIYAWGQWKQNTDPHIPNGDIEKDGIRVSTVFLGSDHRFGFPDEPLMPILWETMIFGGEHDQYCERYTSQESAIEGHRRACELAFNSN